MVFASVIKNDEILKKKKDDIQKMLDPRKMMEQEETMDFNLPNIESLSDVYETGVLCNARANHDQ